MKTPGQNSVEINIVGSAIARIAPHTRGAWIETVNGLPVPLIYGSIAPHTRGAWIETAPPRAARRARRRHRPSYPRGVD